MQKKSNGKKTIAIVSIGLSLLAIVVWVAIVFVKNIQAAVFSGAPFNALGNHISGASGMPIAIAFYVIAGLGLVAFLVSLIVAATHKRGIYVLCALAALIANLAAVWSLLATADVKSLLFLFAVILFVFALLGYCFAFFFSLEKKAESVDEALALSEQIEAEHEAELAKQEAEEAEKEEAEKEEAEEEEEVPAADEAPEEIKAEEPVEETPVEEEPAPEPEPKPEPKKKAPAKKPAKKAPAKKPEEEKKPRVMGKYEIYQEAGYYKFRLKANNGEILICSNSYKTKDGVKKGIDTLKKNVPGGKTKILTDKNGFSQFQIFTANDTRLVVAGEIYPTSAGAQSALASVEKFYATEKVVELDSIPDEEIREWKADLAKVAPADNGKIEIFVDEGSKKFRGRLLASNGQVLFNTGTYVSRTSLLSGIETIKKQAAAGSVSICRDKQNRYQFRVISNSGMVLVMGETYSSKDSALSAANSMRNFLGNAKVVDAKEGE